MDRERHREPERRHDSDELPAVFKRLGHWRPSPEPCSVWRLAITGLMPPYRGRRVGHDDKTGALDTKSVHGS